MGKRKDATAHTIDEVKGMDDAERRKWGYPPKGSPADRAHQREGEDLRAAGVSSPRYPRRLS